MDHRNAARCLTMKTAMLTTISATGVMAPITGIAQRRTRPGRRSEARGRPVARGRPSPRSVGLPGAPRPLPTLAQSGRVRRRGPTWALQAARTAADQGASADQHILDRHSTGRRDRPRALLSVRVPRRLVSAGGWHAGPLAGRPARRPRRRPGGARSARADRHRWPSWDAATQSQMLSELEDSASRQLTDQARRFTREADVTRASPGGGRPPGRGLARVGSGRGGVWSGWGLAGAAAPTTPAPGAAVPRAPKIIGLSVVSCDGQVRPLS